MVILCTTITCLHTYFPGTALRLVSPYLAFQSKDSITYCERKPDYYLCSSAALEPQN